jgi:hypothetical protein
MIAEAERQNRDFTTEGTDYTEKAEEKGLCKRNTQSQGGHEGVVVLRALVEVGCGTKVAALRGSG